MSRLSSKEQKQVSPKEEKQDVYLQFPTRERVDYNHIYVDAKNQVHIMVPLNCGDTIGTDNTCQTTVELVRFFSSNMVDQSGPNVIDQYIEDLNFDLNLLAKHPGKQLQPLVNIIQAKQSRLEQLQKYQQFFRRLGRINIYNQYPESIQNLLARPATNCVNYSFRAIHPDSYVGVNQSYSLVSFPYEFHKDLINKFDRSKISSLSADEKQPQDIDQQISQLTLSIYKKNKIENEQDFNSLKQLIITAYQTIFPDEKAKLSTITYTFIKETFFCETTDSIQDWVNSILLAGKNKSDLNYGADAEEKKKRQSGLEQQPVEQAFLKIAKSLKYENMERFHIAIQFCVATINSHYFTTTNHWLNFGNALSNFELRNSMVVAIQTAINCKLSIDEAIFQFINTHYSDFSMRQPIAPEDWATIQQTFNSQFLQIYDSPHLDEFLVFLPQKKTGPFYSLRNRIVIPLPDYFGDSYYSHTVPTGGPIAHSTHQLGFNYHEEKMDFSLNLSALLSGKEDPSDFLINLLVNMQNAKRLAFTVPLNVIQAIRNSRYGKNIIAGIYYRLPAGERRKFLHHWGQPAIKWFFSASDLVAVNLSQLDLQISVVSDNVATHSQILLHENSVQHATRYQLQIAEGTKQLGKLFYQVLQTEFLQKMTLAGTDAKAEQKQSEVKDSKDAVKKTVAFNKFIEQLPIAEFYQLLASTKKLNGEPNFAITLDGNDWNADEAALLANLTPITTVEIHADAKDSKQVTTTGSMTMPSAISLAYPASRSGVNPDWEEVVVYSDEKGDPNAQIADAKTYGVPIFLNTPVGIELIDFDHFYQINLQRLLPIFVHINQQLLVKQQPVSLTLPAITSGQYIGHFDKNYINLMFIATVKRMLAEYPSYFAQYETIRIDQQEIIPIKKQKIRPTYLVGEQPSIEQKSSSLSLGLQGKAHQVINLDLGSPFTWSAQKSSAIEFVRQNYRHGRFRSIENENRYSYQQLISKQQFSSIKQTDWLVCEENKPTLTITPITKISKVEAKEHKSIKTSMLENRNIQEAVKLFSRLCGLYQITGVIPSLNITLLTDEKVSYQVSLSGKALQNKIEDSLAGIPNAKLLWNWCLRNVTDEKNCETCIERITKLFTIANQSIDQETQTFLNQMLTQIYITDVQSGLIHLDKVFKYYQIIEYIKQLFIPQKERKEAKSSASESFYSLTSEEFLQINPEIITLYHKILKEIVENNDLQLLPLTQGAFFNLESLKNIKSEQIEQLNQWWNCRQILKNTIGRYKRSLGFFNWYGAYRADEVAKKLISHAPEQKVTQKITDFLKTGKSDCDYSCYANFFSWSRSSGTSRTSLRGCLIDELVAEEKIGESRDARIERVLRPASEIKFKI